MNFLVQAAISNAAVVSLLAPIVLGLNRFFHRPVLAHSLCLLILIKLLTPPLVPLGLPWTANMSLPLPFAAPDFPDDESRIRSESILQVPEAASVAQSPRLKPERDPAGLFTHTPSFAQSAAWYVSLRGGTLLASIWLTVSGVWLVGTLVQLIRARQHLRAMPSAPTEVQELAREIARRLGLGGTPQVCFVPGIMSPALWALGRRSQLLVPEELWARLDEDQRTALLAHELAHLRRRDQCIRPLELLVISFYWWFPVAWWVRKSLREAEEQCCDAWVVWLLPESKRAYARTVVDTIDFLAEPHQPLPLAASGFGTVASLRTRLSRIMRGTGPRILSRTGSVCITATSLIVLPVAWGLDRGSALPRGYRIIDLGPFAPNAINNLGQIVGVPQNTGVTHACRWDNGVWTDLGGLVGFDSIATDINDLGQVTGRMGVREPGSTDIFTHAFRTGPNEPIVPGTDDIGSLGSNHSWGESINNSGQVTGYSGRFGGRDHPFRTGPNRPIDPQTDDLGSFDERGWSRGKSINNHGVVVGVALDGDIVRSFWTAPGRSLDRLTDEMRTLEVPVESILADAINDLAQVVGRVTIAGKSSAFRTRPGRPLNPAEDLLDEMIWPWAINSKGWVVGLAEQRQPGVGNWVIHDGNSPHSLSDLILPGSGWTISAAVDVNDRGQVIGEGTNPQGYSNGFLLDPLPDATPGLWLLAGVVLTGLGRTAGQGRRERGSNQRERKSTEARSTP
jgi:probable HAF family extracellular repeat protein